MKIVCLIALVTTLILRADESDAFRYLAWLEGDYQNNYQMDKRHALEKLKDYEGREPNPDDLERYLEFLALLDATDNPAALKRLKAFMVARPSDRRASYLMAVHFLRRGKRDFAKYIFVGLEADASFPWKSLVLNNLGMIALEDKNKDDAMSYFEKAVAARPKISAPNVNLGALYLRGSSYKAAFPLFQEASGIDPDFEDAALGMGVSLEGMGQFKEAGEVYEQYLEKHPDAVSTLYNYSIILGNVLGNRAMAAELMLRYIQKGGKETARAHEIIRSWR